MSMLESSKGLAKRVWKWAEHVHLLVWLYSLFSWPSSAVAAVAGLGTWIWALLTGYYGPVAFALGLVVALAALILIRQLPFGTRKYLSMEEAVRHLHDEIYETEIGLFVTKNFDGDQQLQTLARYIVGTSVPVYGKRPNGTSLVTIDKDTFKSGAFRAAGSGYVFFGRQIPEFTNISIRRSDLRKAIAEVHTLSKALPQRGGYI